MRWTLVGVVVVLLVVVAVMGWQAWSAYRSLRAAQSDLGTLRAQMLDGPSAKRDRTVRTLQDHAASADDSLGGPLWAVAAHLPFLGDDVRATRTVAEGVDTLAADALPPLLKGADTAYPRHGLKDGRVDVDAISRAAPQLRTAAKVLGRVDRRNEALDTRALMGSVQRPVQRFVDAVASVRHSADAASTAADLLPGMLGGKAPRTYLVLNQNTAEQRVLGGIVGSIQVLRVHDGRLRLAESHTGREFGAFPRPVVPLTEAERVLHGSVLAEYMQNATDTPDFPRGAEIATAMWKQRYGGSVDGVLAMDPYALQLILRAVGPVKVDAKHTLDGENAAQQLLNRAYFDHRDPDAQDAFFARAAGAVFAKVTSGAGNPRLLVQGLSQSLDEGRLLVWSAHPDEQRRLAKFRIGGAWPASAAHPTLGVFLHDSSASKIDWYQHLNVRVHCMPDVGQFHASLRLRSEVPKNVDSLPQYIAGNGTEIRRGWIWTQLLLSAPPGWTITDWQASNGDNGVIMMRAAGSWTALRNVRLAPGTSQTIQFTLQPDAPVDRLAVRSTPGATPAHSRFAVSACVP